MDPQELQALLAMLNSSGGSGPPAAAASVPSTPGASTSPQYNYGTTQLLGVANQAGVGGLGSVLAELGAALGIPNIGDLIGLPTEAKTQGIESALANTGSGNDALISQFIGREVGAGNPLSSNTADNSVRRFAAMVQALTGQPAPSATATGFQNNPTFTNPELGKALQRFRLPAGYEFASSPTAQADIYKDLRNTLGLNSNAIFGKGGEGDWQTVVRELIQQGALQKYQGPLGAAGGGNTASGAIPNVSLPHPLTNTANPAFAASPYPV